MYYTWISYVDLISRKPPSLNGTVFNLYLRTITRGKRSHNAVTSLSSLQSSPFLLHSQLNRMTLQPSTNVAQTLTRCDINIHFIPDSNRGLIIAWNLYMNGCRLNPTSPYTSSPLYIFIAHIITFSYVQFKHNVLLTYSILHLIHVLTPHLITSPCPHTTPHHLTVSSHHTSSPHHLTSHSTPSTRPGPADCINTCVGPGTSTAYFII